jgi:uncharacterized protein (UPF0261 family)
MSDKTILVIGTYDTKNDELHYISDRITSMGGRTLTMDVSVLGNPQKKKLISQSMMLRPLLENQLRRL